MSNIINYSSFFYLIVKKKVFDMSNTFSNPLKSDNYFLLTNSLNFLPAEKAGTVFAAILISLPV